MDEGMGWQIQKQSTTNWHLCVVIRLQRKGWFYESIKWKCFDCAVEKYAG